MAAQILALRKEVGPFGTILMTATDCLNETHKAHQLESMRLMADEVYAEAAPRPRRPGRGLTASNSPWQRRSHRHART